MGKEVQDVVRHDVGVSADLEADLQGALEALFFRLLFDKADQASRKSKLVHQRSRQLKQGSMLAMMRPASATLLLRSMKGTVGVFLKLGTWTLRR